MVPPYIVELAFEPSFTQFPSLFWCALLLNMPFYLNRQQFKGNLNLFYKKNFSDVDT